MPATPLAEPGPISHLARIVQPADANSQGDMHGGVALHFMDEAAGMAAMRYTHGNVVTAHVDALDFHRPVHIGMFLEAEARVIAVGTTSMVVEVVLEQEDRFTGERTVTTSGHFVMVAVDEHGKPRPVAQPAVP